MATIAQNLASLQQARTDIAEAITDKGVTLEEGAGFTDFPSAIEDIPTGVDTSNDTVTPATLAEGVTAHDAAGEQITGTMLGGLEMNVKFTAGNKTIPNYMFYNNHGSGSTSSSYPIEEVVIGNGVTRIGSYAFRSCGGLTSITIPNSVTEIGYEAFRSCGGLTSIAIPDSVITIHSIAFQYCTGLTSVTIGNGITKLDSLAFRYCSNLTTITIDKPQDSVSGAPWGATNATVVWTG